MSTYTSLNSSDTSPFQRQFKLALIGFLTIAIGLMSCRSSFSAGWQEENGNGEAEANVAVESQDEPPFARRIDPNFEFSQEAEWLNTGGAIRFRDLRGKFVLFDFWTYCCINCMHVLPTLKKLEEKYPDQLVVIGVHSAKFETEKDADNIREAILRYNIAHPVVNDPGHRIWSTFGVSSWPTLLLFDPEGKAVWMAPGEVQFDTLDKIIGEAIPYYRKQKLLDETPIQFELHAFSKEPTPLFFPGKVLADEASDRLYIADSNHHRIVVSTLSGKLLETIGSGRLGSSDGSFAEAEFNQPQGMALQGNKLIVADTENHLLREVDLQSKQVSTIAGIGTQGQGAYPGLDQLGPLDALPERWVGDPQTTALNSPWTVLFHEDELYIAMAGPHQIWKMNADRTEIGPYAGNGREDIVDGALMPSRPYERDSSSFAQPSGLASDGTWLYVADSEGSSIRAVPFDPTMKVRTVVGTASLAFNRLFSFGDVDGPKAKVKLQHPLGVVFVGGKLFIADTYNNKIKQIDAATGETTTFAGSGEAGADDEQGTFDEPAGISYAADKLYVADTNNHVIRIVDVTDGKVSTLTIEGLTPPSAFEAPSRRSNEDFAKGVLKETKIRAVDGHAKLNVKLKLPKGWKLNPLAPLAYTIHDETFDGLIDNSALADDATRVPNVKPEFDILLPLKSTQGSDQVDIELVYYYCQEKGEGLCKVGAVKWSVPLQVDGSADAEAIKLTHEIKASPFDN